MMMAAGCGPAAKPGKAPASVAFALQAEMTVGTADRNPADPYLQAGPDGKLYLSWTEATSGKEGRDGWLATLGGDGKPGQPRRLNDQPGEIAGHGGENLVRYAVGSDGSVTAAWMQPLGATHTGLVRSAHAAAGAAFAPAATVNDDKKEVNHAFASVAAADGKVFAAWIDGRERTDPKDDRQTLFLAVSEDGGKSFGANSRVGEAVCPCCRTSTLVLDGGKTVLVSYRSVQKPSNIRNHVVVRSTDGGRTFGPAVTVSDDGWSTPGCPHAGLAMAADSQGRVHAAWWTGGRTPDEAGIYYTYSDDGGQHFAPRELVAKAPADTVLHAQVVADGSGGVYLAWENVADGHTQVYVAHRAAGAADWGKTYTVSGGGGLSAIFPTMAVSGGRLYIAWTETNGETSAVKLRVAASGAGAAADAGAGTKTAAAGPSLRLADDFALKDLDGKTRKLSDLRGQPVVLNFFASWCEPCRQEAPLLQGVARDGHTVLGVAVKDTGDAVRSFMADEGLSFPVVLDGENKVGRTYKVVGPPATFFLDAHGRVVSAVYGPLEPDSLARELHKLH